jgi:copper chaperone CopZ
MEYKMRKLVTIGFILLMVAGMAITTGFACEGEKAENASKQSECSGKAELAEGQTKVKLAIAGMSCGSCCTKVETAVKDMAGVISIDADYENGIATVVYEEGTVQPKAMIKAINAKTSFKASMPTES